MRENLDNLVYGRHAVEEYLAQAADRVRVVMVEAGNHQAAVSVRSKAESLGIKVRVLPRQAFDSLARGRPFQGVAAEVAPFAATEAETLISLTAKDRRGLLVAADSIQDPQNLGSILRSAAFFGATGLILPRDRSAAVTPAVARISAGAVTRVPVATVTNLARTIRLARESGLTAIGAVAHGGLDAGSLSRPGPQLLVVGAEAEGLRRLVRESCDCLVTIPAPGGFESLNAGVAAGILMYVLRLRT